MDRKHNNKGVSLVEVLIALAIGCIVLSALVLLIQQSVKGYTKQTISAQLQNDADITLNQMENDVMEANVLLLNKAGAYPYILTKEKDGKYSGYVYSKDEKTIYDVEELPDVKGVAVFSGKSLVCDHVDSFDFYISENSLGFDGNGSNPAVTSVGPNIRVEISLGLTRQSTQRSVTRQILTRNKLSDSQVLITTDRHNLVGKLKSDILEYCK